MNDVGDAVKQRVTVEVEPARDEEVRAALEERHQCRDARGITRHSRLAHSAAEHGRNVGERVHAELSHLSIRHVALHPRADHRSVATVGREELRQKSAQLFRADPVGRDRPDVAGERVHLMRAFDCERAQQVLLVGEIQVEGAVRRPSRAHDVIDTGGMEPAFSEHAHAGVE